MRRHRRRKHHLDWYLKGFGHMTIIGISVVVTAYLVECPTMAITQYMAIAVTAGLALGATLKLVLHIDRQ